ncbi:uncharacterized protein [Argopecten irradians]|uniref:uncharacterized protein isoform X1 n=1 Tax=Argopecten irradians TaxID=31199 RepID=UPI0037162B53
MANSAEAGGLTNTPMLEQVFVNPDHSSQVLYQLSELWRDKKLCDATIEVGPVKVYVHRLVLLAACPYLLTVGGQHEVSILEVKLPMTVGLEGLNVFLTYLYDGVLHLTSGNLRSVEKLTKILKVTSIQKFCQEFRDSNKETGVADKLSTDYSLKMTNSSLQIIFSEIQSEMKRENTEAEPDTPSKRPRMNLDKLSAALQKKSGQSESGKDSERCHSVSSSMPSETQHDDSSSDPLMMQVKEEPVSDYEDDDDGGYSEDTSESFGGTTDFVRQAPYDTRPFPKEPSATSSNKLPVNIPPPPSLQKRPSFKQKSFPPSAQSSETDVASETDTGPEGSSVDATKVLKNIVKSMPEMAMNLGTSSEMGDDNKPSFGNEDWAMYMVRPQAQKKKSRMELPLEKKIELIREYKTSPRPRQKAFAMKYGLGRSTVSDILKKSDFYMKQYEENADLNKRRFHNSCKFEQLNRFMWSWYLEARARGVPVSGTMIQERSLKYAQELRMPDFKASNGWLQSWKSRYSIKSFKTANNETGRSRVGYMTNNPQEDSARIEVVPHILDMSAAGMAPPIPPNFTEGQDCSKIGLLPSDTYSEEPMLSEVEKIDSKTTGSQDDVSSKKLEITAESDEEEDDDDTEESDPGSPDDVRKDDEHCIVSGKAQYPPSTSGYSPPQVSSQDVTVKPYHQGYQQKPDYHISPTEFDMHAKGYLDTSSKHFQPPMHLQTSFDPQGKPFNVADIQEFKVQSSNFENPGQSSSSSAQSYGAPNSGNFEQASSHHFSLQQRESGHKDPPV